jgi:PTS system nitrogen regulatory IIA component
MSTAMTDILSPALTVANVHETSKKCLLEKIGQLVADYAPAIAADQLYNALLARERLGSTGVGQGIAIPHCRVAGCEKALGVLLQLAQGIDFDAADQQPVDLVFALVVPEENQANHLLTLQNLAKQFGRRQYCACLRQAANSQALYQAAIN